MEITLGLDGRLDQSFSINKYQRKLTPTKTDVGQVFIVINENWSNKNRVQINRFSEEPTMIGQDTVLHHSLGHSAANGSLEEEV